MNTFLPYADFTKSAKCLDRQRLGKQRVEIYQILRALHGETKGWVNHPATKIWKGFEGALIDYGIFICNEWIKRGYKDTCLQKIYNFKYTNPDWWINFYKLPPWLGDEQFHSSHRAALLMKNPEWYSPFGWKEKPEIKYFWPGNDK